MLENRKTLSTIQSNELILTLKTRFEKNMNRHEDFVWEQIQVRLEYQPVKLWSLSEMERTGGEPDVVDYIKHTGEFIFFDCSPESPIGRRSFCYDRAALDARKADKPADNVIENAQNMGVELLTEQQYRALQTLGSFDTKTSSWLQTPESISKLGGAIFGDRRYDQVFIYHNGVQSYYAARGFRTWIHV